MSDIFPKPRIILEISENLIRGCPKIEFAFENNKNDFLSPGKKIGAILPVRNENAEIVFKISLGEKTKVDNISYFKAASAFARWVYENPYSDIFLDLDQDTVENDPLKIRLILEGLAIGAFEFNRYKTKTLDHSSPVKIKIFSSKNPNLSSEINRAVIVGNSLDLARDWISEPANIINPQTLEDRIKTSAETYKLGFKVIQNNELLKMGAGGLTGVGRGSKEKPRLIILEYKGKNEPFNPIALIGKAITFDTGGYSLKGVDSIKGMKFDKTGGISVLATIIAAARLKIKTNLVALIPIAENMISGDAYRPDDILTLLSGLTVEISTTDAEGRLILADAISYAQTTYKPSAILDIATLTGGVKIALGTIRAGLLSNSDKIAESLFRLGEKNGEKVWRLPMDEEYFDLLKSESADMKNAGTRDASTIAGGIFLQQVVDPSIPWAHLDIAATASNEFENNWNKKGPSGFGIRLLLDAVEELSSI